MAVWEESEVEAWAVQVEAEPVQAEPEALELVLAEPEAPEVLAREETAEAQGVPVVPGAAEGRPPGTTRLQAGAL